MPSHTRTEDGLDQRQPPRPRVEEAKLVAGEARNLQVIASRMAMLERREATGHKVIVKIKPPDGRHAPFVVRLHYMAANIHFLLLKPILEIAQSFRKELQCLMYEYAQNLE